MGVMNKMRENTGVVLWVLVIAFGALWTLQDSGAFDVIGVVGNNIAVVNGDDVPLEDYNRAVNAQIQNEQNRTGDEVPPQRADQIRDQVFNALVEDQLRQQEMDRLGIAVTDEELVDMVVGNDPHPLIGVYFSDGQGGVDRALLQNFIDNPDAQAQWIQLEDILRQQRRTEKLNKLVDASVRISEADIMDEYVRQNKTVDAEYVALRYASIPDDSVEVTDRDLRDYYNENREDFARARTFTLNYVALSKDPTPEDTSSVLQELEGMRAEFIETDEDSLFVMRYGSERPYTNAYFRPNELDTEIAEAVFADLEVGRVMGPMIVGSEAHLVKIVDVQEAEEAVIKARHILYRAPEGDEAALAAARAKAIDARNRIRGGADFAEIARAESEDRGSGALGGDLGWFDRTRMVEPFSDAAFGARIGQLVGPVETQFGLHLIEVTERSTQEVQVADYAQRIRASVATLNRVVEQLDDVQYFTTESGDFAAEAERAGLDIQTVTFEADQDFIPGIGNSNALRNFLARAEVGRVTDVIELDRQYIVATVTDITEEGYTPLDEVRNRLEPQVRLAKKREIQRARFEELFANGFDSMKQAPGVQSSSANDLKLNAPVVAGLGRDETFVGTAFGMEANTTSGVIEGPNAVYALRVTSVTEPAAVTDAQKDQIRTSLENTLRNSVRTEWLANLREEADITDNRRLFQQ